MYLSSIINEKGCHMKRRNQLKKILYDAYKEGYSLNSQYIVKISQELDKFVVNDMKKKGKY